MFARMKIAVVVAALGCAAGCTNKSSPSTAVSPTGPDGGRPGAGAKAKPKTKTKTAALKSKAGSKPPANATSKGAQTKPKAGALTVPINDVEVYTFEEADAEDGLSNTVSWAYVEAATTTYLWLTGPVACADGSEDPNGAFVMDVKEDGSGSFIFSAPECPASDLYGCDFDAAGAETTCGACSLDGDVVVCTASE